jgi:DNA-binding protein H-NS
MEKDERIKELEEENNVIKQQLEKFSNIKITLQNKPITSDVKHQTQNIYKSLNKNLIKLKE